MKLKYTKRRTLMAVIALTAGLLVTTGWTVMADVERTPVFVPSGVYVCFGDHIWTDTIIPNDPAGNTTTHIEHFLVTDPTLGGIFPEADTRRNAVGRGVRIGPESWQVTWIQYGAKGTELQYMMLYCALVTFSEDRETMFMEWTAQCHLPESDVDGDGFPDEGQEPLAARPGSATLRRIPQRPLYEFPPPPEE